MALSARVKTIVEFFRTVAFAAATLKAFDENDVSLPDIVDTFQASTGSSQFIETMPPLIY